MSSGRFWKHAPPGVVTCALHRHGHACFLWGGVSHLCLPHGCRLARPNGMRPCFYPICVCSPCNVCSASCTLPLVCHSCHIDVGLDSMPPVSEGFGRGIRMLQTLCRCQNTHRAKAGCVRPPLSTGWTTLFDVELVWDDGYATRIT